MHAHRKVAARILMRIKPGNLHQDLTNGRAFNLPRALVIIAYHPHLRQDLQALAVLDQRSPGLPKKAWWLGWILSVSCEGVLTPQLCIPRFMDASPTVSGLGHLTSFPVSLAGRLTREASSHLSANPSNNLEVMARQAASNQ